VWFLVDDNLTFHKKVTQAGNPALGAWVRAGAWSAANLTDGFVPINVARQFCSRSNIDTLVKVGLWSRVTGGYQFHDWNDVQPTAEQVKQRRDDARQRKAKQRQNPHDVTRDIPRDLTRAPDKPLRGLLQGRVTAPAPERADAPRPRADAARSDTAPSNDDHDWSAIPNCDLCDDDGRKPNGMVCDHIDRRFTNALGSKNLRETMGWKT